MTTIHHPGRPKMTRLPRLLGAHLKAHSMSIEDVAEYTGASPRQVDRWLKGDSEPRREMEHLLAEMLGVSPVDFWEPGAYAEIPVSPGLYEEIRSALADLEKGQDKILRVLLHKHNAPERS